jgi:hypothetical protein
MRKHKTQLLERVQTLIEKAQGTTFIVPDDTGFFSIEDDLVRDVRASIEQAVALLGEIGDLYDAESHEDGHFEQGDEDDFLREIGAAISSELAAREIGNMAFVARAQLLESSEGLASAIANRFIWVVASHADTGLRRACRSLITLESAMREYEGLAPVERRWSDIKDSLEIRRLYAQFRRAILRSNAVDADLEIRLRGAANRIAVLRDLQIYPFLRIYDRLPIRRLQKRILGWLERSALDPGRDEEGRQLWSDLVSFAELLGQINNREDLREHDRRTVQRLYRLFFEARQPPVQIQPVHLSDLELLIGRDEELDQIILNLSKLGIETLREPLERIQHHLNRPFAAIEETISPLF